MKHRWMMPFKRQWAALAPLRDAVAKFRKGKGWTQDQAAEALQLSDDRRFRYIEKELATMPPPDIWRSLTDTIQIDRIQLLIEIGYLQKSDAASISPDDSGSE